ncbi:MAG TPA: penicillin-binding protein 2 [Gemmatimonadaceae bacterium]|nr:penicillin-binding protein 2 [Gemmatimonadaceae bacterium]
MSFHPNDIARRSRIASVLLIAAFVWLGGAFFRAQVQHHEDYELRSRLNRLREVPLPAPRGIIYDRNGQIIAESVPGYTVLLTLDRGRQSQRAMEDTLRATLRRLGQIIDYPEEQIESAVRRYRRDPNRPAVVLADADFTTVSVLEERVAEFPGLLIQAAPKRFYPLRDTVGAFVGYTGEINETELGSSEYEGYKAGQQIGKSGLEKQYEARLRGKEGMRFVEVDARNRVVKRENVRPDLLPEAPPPLYTNIDLDLQRFVFGLMEGDTSLTGGILALDPRTGGVLAMHSNPTFDPNHFIGGISTEEYAGLTNDPRHPLYNKVIQGRYPPASTFKLITSAIAIERGVVNLDTRMPQPCTGGMWIGNRYFRCWDHSGHGDITLRQAIAKSCDVYFYQLGLRLGLEEMLAGGVRIGMNEKSGIDLPNELKPRWPADIKYFDDTYGPQHWSRTVVASLAIGQADDAQTVANMARLYAALATDGAAPRPRIVQGDPVRTPAFRLSDEQLDGLRLALADVVSARGTAGASALQGITIAGKTGTAQTGRPGERDHAWFVGFAPAEDPKIVVAVFIEHGEHGSAAARLASRTIEQYLRAPTAPVPVTEEGP